MSEFDVNKRDIFNNMNLIRAHHCLNKQAKTQTIEQLAPPSSPRICIIEAAEGAYLL